MARNCAAQWGSLRIYPNPDIPPEQEPAIAEAVRQNEIEFGRRQGEELRARAAEAVEIIRRHQEADHKSAVLDDITTLRHTVLAHRDTKERVEISDLDSFDERVEAFYQDMAKLVRLLRLVVENVSYNPDDTAEIYRKNAAYFWAGVRGERTPGHPDYEPPARSID